MEVSGDQFRLSAGELQMVSNHCDFLGIDPYTVTVIEPAPEGIAECAGNPDHYLWPECVIQSQTDQHGWKVEYRSQSYVHTAPKHLRSFLNYLWDWFQIPIIITEFGFPEWREKEKPLAD